MGIEGSLACSEWSTNAEPGPPKLGSLGMVVIMAGSSRGIGVVRGMSGVLEGGIGGGKRGPMNPGFLTP